MIFYADKSSGFFSILIFLTTPACIWIKALPRQSRFFVGVSHRRARDVCQNSISLLSQRRRMIVLEWINEAPATNMHAVRLECTRSLIY